MKILYQEEVTFGHHLTNMMGYFISDNQISAGRKM